MSELDDLLQAAVTGVGGTPREGQQRMAHAVQEAVEHDHHLLVQAGTGTGKSLAYLVPAIAHAVATGKPAVVATATLALQAQIVDRDLPRLAEALRPRLGRKPTFALVKGRANYVCQHKLVGGFPADDGDALLGAAEVERQSSRLGEEVVRLREWAEVTESGDRDELVPGVSNRAWRQVSVSARECLGQNCPMVSECFVEESRAAAREADVVVTNHAFMAIDAFEGRQMLPEHDLLVVDEAHELVDRITATVTAELTPGAVGAAATAAGKWAETGELAEAGEELRAALEALPDGRLMGLPETLTLALAGIRDTARRVQSDLRPESGAKKEPADGARQTARAAIDEVHAVAERVLEGRDLDVAWVTHDERRGFSTLYVAPLSVAMQVREHVMGERTVVLTSATLELGGTFDTVAGSLGLLGPGAPRWEGLDAGSPFDYPKQGIAYVAKHLPPPGRDGTSPQTFDELEHLIRAAGGRTLGLFSSRRAAEAAAVEMRERLAGSGIEILCQGEDQLPTLVRTFASDVTTCLFGTLSLWQGVDVPGSACQLVVIDRIPFPRPDDPLASARSQDIARRGGNGFMAVSATHAALRLAQGAGRLIRRSEDRGVVAFLDSRMMTARYAGFLQRSMPDFWPTTDPTLVRSALSRLDAAADPPLPLADARATPGKATPDSEPTAAAVPAPEPVPVARSPRSAVTGGHAWTEEQDGELRDGVESGLDLVELADHLELPPDAVTARLGQLGLALDPA